MKTMKRFLAWVSSLFKRNKPVVRHTYYTAEHIANLLSKYNNEFGIVTEGGNK